MNTEQPLATQPAESSPKSVATDIECEVRFAVVMYGGVSLAIYINGVAQELLNMVRATAPASTAANASALIGADEIKLPGAMGVYRKLGQFLLSQDDLAQAAKPDNNGKPRLPTQDAIRVQFVVDVISGTSAGGINGVFLAKALSEDQKMEGLKQLWLSEGDLGKLLNDKQSLEGMPGFKIKKPEESLLNSQRMYRKLLEALAQMDDSQSISSVYRVGLPSKASPLVRELDLFTTTTDIEGLPLPIALSDKLVFERRYKNVFHFRYARGSNGQVFRNDFEARNDPFLAFAARCTSSFPFAFEPMCLSHITEITESYPRYNGAKRYISKWDPFFDDYLRPGLYDIDRDSRNERTTGELPGGPGLEAVKEATDDLRDAFMSRAFGDGGYLDNKPFTYATATLMRRSSDGAVKRKLLYVEPSPDHPELLSASTKQPDFAENVRAAVLDLPRQETIREDIERLKERNRILDRLLTFAREADDDIIDTSEGQKLLPRKEFQNGDVRDGIRHYGLGYGPYHRLKVGDVTSFLAEIVTHAKGHDSKSDAATAVRELVAAWRREVYPQRKNGEIAQSENQFLFVYDLHYRFRHVVFLIRRVNELLQLDPVSDSEDDTRIKNLLRISLVDAWKDPDPSIDFSLVNEVDTWLKSAATGNAQQQLDPFFAVWLDGFCNELEWIKKNILTERLDVLRATEHGLLRLPQDPAFKPDVTALRQLLEKINVPWTDLREILARDGLARTDLAKLLCEKHFAEFKSVADEVGNILEKGKPQIANRIIEAPYELKISPEISARYGSQVSSIEFYSHEGALAARLCLLHYNKNFITYDMVMYPVEYGTGAGETNQVEVFRVSPEDAPSLMTERPEGNQTKLAGRTLMSFGAFLDEGWRKNDMLWGRLDGAERLIAVTLPDKTPDETRRALIREAHLGILCEEIKQGNGDAVCRLLSHARWSCVPTSDRGCDLQALVATILNDCSLAQYVTNAQCDLLRAPEKFDRHLEAETALNYIARSTNITGNMLSGLADKYHSDPGKRVGAWIARLGTAFWSMVAVAVPQSLGNIFFRRWLGLLYLFSAVVILAGIFFHSARSIGWQLLAITIGLNLITLLLGDFMAGGKRLLRALRRSLILVVAALIGFGTYFVASHSLDFFANYRVQSGIVAGSVVLILLGLAEWWRWLKRFLSAPTTSFSYRLLIGLTLATAMLAGALALIGPVDMAGFELSRTTTIADKFRDFAGVDRLRLQLAVDFALIVAYAAMLASYCVAGAKLFWQRRDNILYRFNEKQTRLAKARKENNAESTDQKDPIKEPPWSIRAACILITAAVVVGFFIAGLQWLAGLADVSENVGLLLYLKEKPPTEFDPLKVAYWSATVKFSLIALGATYAAFALTFGAATKLGDRPVARKPNEICKRVLFVLVSLAYIWFCWHGLFVCQPEPCKNCPPSLLSIFTTAKKFPATPSQSCD